jgi:hypothetical protein
MYANLSYSCKHELYMFGRWWAHAIPTGMVHQGQGPLQRANSKSKRGMMFFHNWKFSNARHQTNPLQASN